MCVYLAVEVRGVDAGFDDVEQGVHQTITGAHLPPGLLTCRAQVPVTHTHHTHIAHTHTTQHTMEVV